MSAPRLGLTGPAVVVSAACASTSKAFGNAARMIGAGFCDAAIVGGADSLCPDHAVRLPVAGPDLTATLPPVRCGAGRHLDR